MLCDIRSPAFERVWGEQAHGYTLMAGHGALKLSSCYLYFYKSEAEWSSHSAVDMFFYEYHKPYVAFQVPHNVRRRRNGSSRESPQFIRRMTARRVTSTSVSKD